MCVKWEKTVKIPQVQKHVVNDVAFSFCREMLTRTTANVRHFHKLVGSLERENCRYYEQVLYDNWNNLSRRNGKRTLEVTISRRSKLH